MARRRDDGVAFELERFAWQAPDRLEISGRFSELDQETNDAPVLVVHGADGDHRLALLPGSVSGPPAKGEWWRAAFLWEQPPVPFEAAELRLGDGIAVELPEPRSIVPGAGAERLRLAADLIEANEEASELRAALERAQEELGRVRADLESEQSRSAADAKRFHESLAKVKASAEEALAAEQEAAQQLGNDLRGALAEIGAKDAAMQDLRGRLEAAAAAHAQALDDARAQALQDAREELRPTRIAALEARSEAERLAERLTAIAGALQDDET